MQKLWKILVVDDQPENLDVLRAILSDTYVMAFARSGEQAIEAAARHRPDLILLDIMMPGMDGLETCRRLKSDPKTAQIPVIFVTALGEIQDEEYGFAVGAVDYIAKPVSASIVRARVRTHIALVDQEIALNRLGVAGEFKDNDTAAHVRRMGYYSEILAGKLGYDEGWCRAIAITAPMHDVGKIAVPERILLKPGKLDADEWDVMTHHPQWGEQIIGRNGPALMRIAASIALHHHEKWDGSGYPLGLAGEAISIEGRIVAVADVFDALMSRRPYKEPWPLEKAIAFMRDQSGSHFDPEVIAAFLGAEEAFSAIRLEQPDTTA